MSYTSKYVWTQLSHVIHVDVVTVQLICFSESDVPFVHMFAVFYAYLPVDIQTLPSTHGLDYIRICNGNDVSSLGP